MAIVSPFQLKCSILFYSNIFTVIHIFKQIFSQFRNLVHVCDQSSVLEPITISNFISDLDDRTEYTRHMCVDGTKLGRMLTWWRAQLPLMWILTSWRNGLTGTSRSSMKTNAKSCTGDRINLWTSTGWGTSNRKGPQDPSGWQVEHKWVKCLWVMDGQPHTGLY